MRVVSLNCSNTEIVHALGMSQCLVGVDVDSDWPPDVVAALPRVGRDLGIDPAKVAALRPDLVLGSLTVPGHEAVVAAIEATGLPFYAPETTSLDDVHADIVEIARRLGVPERGHEVVASMRAAMPARQVAADAPSILVEWWPKPAIGAARRSWVHDIITLVGARNALAGRNEKSSSIAPPELGDLEIDIVVISWCGVPTARYRPRVVLEREGWDAVTAVAKRRVHAIPEAYLGRPGPRLVEGYAALRRLVAADSA